MLLEYSIGPKSTRGTIIGQGNLALDKAVLKKAGKAIARSQRIVFHFSRFFFSELLFIQLTFLRSGWVGSIDGSRSGYLTAHEKPRHLGLCGGRGAWVRWSIK